jgi:hypothetical protein
MRQAREAMMIALGKGEQPVFVSKAKERWEETRLRYEAAAERLDRSDNRADRALARDVRAFLQERPSIETVPDRALREAARRVMAALDREGQRPAPPPPERPAPTRRR